MTEKFALLIKEADDQINELVSYIHLKVKAKDWHAVADAAMDIRELEARKDALFLMMVE